MISILLKDLRGGGAERVMLDLAKEFARRGLEVEFVLMEAIGEFLEEAQKDFLIVDLGVSRTRWVPIAFAKYLYHRKPNEVIANMWPVTSAAVIARFLARSECRLLLVDHNSLKEQYAARGNVHNWMLSVCVALTYRFADVVSAVSHGAAIQVAQLARIPYDHVNVLHNPIPQRKIPTLAEVQNVEELWNCPVGERILTVGSLKNQKNHRLLLNAFCMLKRPEARLMLLGKGENESSLRALSFELGIADRVIFAGFHDNPAPFYSSASVFVLSSDYEGFGNVIVEALSFGIPVVSTNCVSGPSEILVDGRFGQLVPVGNASALGAAILMALNRVVDSSELVRRSEDFAPEIAAQKYIDLLGIQ